MASGDSSQVDELTLSAIFKSLWDTYVMIEHSEDSSSADKIQGEVRKALAKAEQGISMVNELHLFSDNEEIEEVATNEIKYVLLPALLAYYHGLNTHASRLETIQKAITHYKDYLKLCKSYKVTSDHIPIDLEEEEHSSEGAEPAKSAAVAHPHPHPAGDLHTMAVQRNCKIERYKQTKKFESRLKELSAAVEKESVDDELKREFYLTQLKTWINKALDEIESFTCEIQILQHMAQMKKEGKQHHHLHEEKKPSQTLRPFILTKDAMQKQVYGLGYPAIPTMSIEEFYQHKVDDGTFSIPQGPARSSFQGRAENPDLARKEDEQEDLEREKKEEEDDPELLRGRRCMDEYKDHYRRGWGNRKNMG